MHFLKSISNLLIYNYIFIAFCAVAMFLQTDILFNKNIHELHYYIFVFFATLFAYNIYYIKSNFTNTHLLIAIFSGSLALYSIYKIFNTINISIGLSIVFLSIIYLIPAYFIIKTSWISYLKLFVLTIIWFLTTCILPINYLHLTNIQYGYLIHQFVFIFILCFHFYIKDEVSILERKKHLSVLVLLNVLLLIVSIVVFSLGQIALLFASLILLLLSIYIYKKQPSKIFYLVFVDGMMLLQSIFVIVSKIYIE